VPQLQPPGRALSRRNGWRERLVCSWRGSRQVVMVARVKCASILLLPPRIMSRQTSERIYPEPL
jgi:hypothetical protein